MDKIKLTNGTILNISDIKVEKGVLKITTPYFTVEELAALFSDKEKTNLIILMTESECECGYKAGFTSFSGIYYEADGNKTVELFQPADITEKRISDAEGMANKANNTANEATEKTSVLEEQNVVIAATIDSILTDIIPGLMA